METLPSTTTAEQDLKTRGQRRVNLIWEVTQAVIAIMVVGTTLSAALRSSDERSAFIYLATTGGAVIGFYFGRTNHTKTGGVGARNGDER